MKNRKTKYRKYMKKKGKHVIERKIRNTRERIIESPEIKNHKKEV